MAAAPTPADIQQQFATLISNAFAIVAALAWSDALRAMFDHLELFKGHAVVGGFVMAALITLAAFMAGRALGKYAKQPCTRLCDAPTTSPTWPPTTGEPRRSA